MNVVKQFQQYAVVVLDSNNAPMLDDSGETRIMNYGVYNSETEAYEYKCMTLPQAIGVAAQFSHMVNENSYIDMLNTMFGEGAGDVSVNDEESQDPSITH